MCLKWKIYLLYCEMWSQSKSFRYAERSSIHYVLPQNFQKFVIDTTAHFRGLMESLPQWLRAVYAAKGGPTKKKLFWERHFKVFPGHSSGLSFLISIFQHRRTQETLRYASQHTESLTYQDGCFCQWSNGSWVIRGRYVICSCLDSRSLMDKFTHNHMSL